MPESISSRDSPFDVGQIIDTVLAQSSFFGATRKEHERTRQENFEDIVEALKHGRKFGSNYFQNFVQYGIEDFPFSDFIYSLPSGNHVLTLEEHFLEAQDATALPIWRPEIFFEYPDTELEEQEILDLLELFRCCLMGKRAVSVGKVRNAENPEDTQKDSYQLGILTLNLGHINRHPYIGGSSKFPSWVRKDNNYRALPYLFFRNSAHIVTLCEANDEHGGIAIHQQLASDHSMIGMVANAEITAPSLAIFSRGNHFSVTFIELIGHYQAETDSKEPQNRFWLLHGAIFRLSYGHITSGEIIDPTTGIGTTKPTDVTPNMSATVKPHPAPLASTQDSPDLFICEIDGRCDAQHADLLQPTSGADTHDVKRLGLAEVRIGVFIYSYAWSDSYSEACEKWLHFVAS